MSNFSFSIFPNENYIDLRLYQYGWEQCEPLHSFGPFIRNHYLFHYIISGKGTLDSTAEDGVTHRYSLEAGQGFLICPGQINTYSADADDPWKYAWLEFDGLRAAEYLGSAGLGVAQPIYQPGDPALAGNMRDIMLYITDHSNASALHLIGCLCLFLAALIRSSAIEEIADVCKLNRNYFSKIFKESMGCTPQEFLIRMRLAKATELMRTEDLPIKDISALCGYPNQLHFSRAFKQRYGTSPREWRNQNKLHHIKRR